LQTDPEKVGDLPLTPRIPLLGVLHQSSRKVIDGVDGSRDPAPTFNISVWAGYISDDEFDLDIQKEEDKTGRK
jgi:hypothetical protein